MNNPDESKQQPPTLTPETFTAQALGRIDPTTQALVPPLHTSTTYQRDADGEYRSGRGYTRPHNPTYDEPAALLSALEHGRDCLLFASGQAAATAVFQALLPGDHVVAARVMYWALRSWLTDFAMTWGLQVEFVDTTDPATLAAAIRPGKTRLVWLETPANPTWDISDIAVAAAIAHRAHAQLVVDSTVATPVLTRPLELGADLVVHSASKYLNGHSDVLAGALICAEQDAFWQRIRTWHRDAGAVLGPFEAWLLLRGMRTLFVRVERCCANALTIAQHFQQHPRLRAVLYPGLPQHPGHAIAARQMSGGFGGMLSIRLKDGEAAAMAAAARVNVFKRATSLGGVESLIEHRASIEGPSTPVPSDLLRLSIGIENSSDLIADLEQALDYDRASISLPAPASDEEKMAAMVATSADDAIVSAIKQRLDLQIRPMLADRGGDLQFRGFTEGIVELTLAGSPGAALPVAADIGNLLRHYIPEVSDVRLLPADSHADKQTGEDIAEQVQRILDEQINPAVQQHGGVIELVEIRERSVSLRLTGGCQGCAMAHVTLRQGVEVMLKEQVPELQHIIDVTDHAAGRHPYFKTRKGTA